MIPGYKFLFWDGRSLTGSARDCKILPIVSIVSSPPDGAMNAHNCSIVATDGPKVWEIFFLLRLHHAWRMER